jgi:uncharacterized protein (DUF2267 family)
MSATTISPIERTVHLTNSWLKELMEELDCDNRQRAYHALGAVLHALRDRLTVDETVDLGAQLPMLVRGLYYEGWKPGNKPVKQRTKEDFLAQIAAALPGEPSSFSEDVAWAVFKVLQRHVSAGEIRDVKHVLPAAIRSLWPMSVGAWRE